MALAQAGNAAKTGAANSLALARAPPPRPIVVVAKKTSQFVAGLVGTACATFVGAVTYEAWLSADECAVVKPLRVAAAPSTVRGGKSPSDEQGFSPQDAKAMFVGTTPASSSSRPVKDAAERSCLVIGGGVIGITTAYFLARKGFDVTVLEKRPDVGQEASSVGAGLLSRPEGVSPKGALSAGTQILRDELRGLTPWVAFKLWAAKWQGGIDWLGLRTYWTVLNSEEHPDEILSREPPREDGLTNEQLREAAAKAAAYDATYFVYWSPLVFEQARFAFGFAARAIMEAWNSVVPQEEDSELAVRRVEAAQALTRLSSKALREIIDRERLKCPIREGPRTTVFTKGAPWLKQGDAWSVERSIAEFPYLVDKTAQKHNSAQVILPSDAGEESGICDCEAFTQQLAVVCRDRYNVKFRYGCEVRELQMDDVQATGRMIGRVQCADGKRFQASYVVLASGPSAQKLAKSVVNRHCAHPWPVHLPLCNVCSYSLALPTSMLPIEALEAFKRYPRVYFEPTQLSASLCPGPTEATLRFLAIEEIAAKSVETVGSGLGAAAAKAAAAELKERRAALLRQKAAAALPGLAPLFAKAEVKSGYQCQTFDDLPIISGTRYHNLFVNVGHGNRGWGLACGSAAVLSEMLDMPEGETASAVQSSEATAVALSSSWAFSLQRFAGAKLLWRAQPPKPSDEPSFTGSRVGPMEVLMMGPALRPGYGW
mmetsp:Transcript_95458/g.199684  ORF Transcript_95458/g.199684 Transcript_95458/m.199684 type:complete len:713 (+) Transcript_95458:111-2249(+)